MRPSLYLVWMLRSKAPVVFFRSDDLKRFVIPKHGKDDVTELMHDSLHCHWLFLAGAFPGILVVNHRGNRCAVSLINLYVIKCGHVKNIPGKAGATLVHMDFIAIEFFGLFDSEDNPKMGLRLFRGRKKFEISQLCDQDNCD